MGLTDKDNVKDVTASARKICNEFPGSLTLPFGLQAENIVDQQIQNVTNVILINFV